MVLSTYGTPTVEAVDAGTTSSSYEPALNSPRVMMVSVRYRDVIFCSLLLSPSTLPLYPLSRANFAASVPYIVAPTSKLGGLRTSPFSVPRQVKRSFSESASATRMLGGWPSVCSRPSSIHTCLTSLHSPHPLERSQFTSHWYSAQGRRRGLMGYG